MDLFDDFESESDYEFEDDHLVLPGTEIPKSFKFNHQSFGNSISFRVGSKFPKLVIRVAFRSAEAHIDRRQFYVHVSINGRKQNFNYLSTVESYEELWLFSKSLGQLNKLNLSEQNQVEVEVEVTCDRGNHTDFIKWFRVNVECICCPQKSDITNLPRLSDTELPPFQPVFPTSFMDCGAFNNEGDLGNSVEPANSEFEPGLKGFLGHLNVSLSAPNDSELLALLPLPCGPNMDHEVSNTVNDLRLLKGIHNDGCDSDERECEPPLFPVTTNGFDLGFAQPNLELGSSVSDGFHLASSSMAHACVNDDSDFNMGPPPKKTRTS